MRQDLWTDRFVIEFRRHGVLTGRRCLWRSGYRCGGGTDICGQNKWPGISSTAAEADSESTLGYHSERRF